MPTPDHPLSSEVFDTLDTGLIILDGDCRVLGWNAWMASASGVPACAARGRTLGEVFPGADFRKVCSGARTALDSGASTLLTQSLHPATLPLKTRSGRALIHNIAVRPLGDRPYARCLVQITDVTAATDRERVLRERLNARYDAVVESAPDPILTLDAKGVIQIANPACAVAFGQPSADLAGLAFTSLLDRTEAWNRAWRAVLDGGEVYWPLELAVRRCDGAIGWAEASASSWSMNSRTFVTVILRDVNERRAHEAELRRLNETLEERVAERSADLERAHEQLRQSQKMEAVGQLTGGIAHDFNNLLTPIIGGLDILQNRGVGDERGRRLIEGALQSAERARVLVQRLLAFARRQPLQPQPVDVSQVIHGMADLVGSTLGPRIRIMVDVAEDLPPALADPNQLEMALLNLAVNARDAMEDGGTLTISATPAEVGKSAKLAAGPYVRLAVSDTGVGMDAATLARAVEPFFSTKGIGKGTGLGLSMIHGLAAQLGGGLELFSTPGVGTTVEMWLPVGQHVVVSTAPADVRTRSGGGSGRVLLVDDEELIRTSTAQMLADLGYTVVEASSAKAALSHLADSRIGLVVTDHLMPGMTGAQFAREIQARRPEVPILIISGFSDVDDIAPDLKRLMKPFRESELAAALNAIS